AASGSRPAAPSPRHSSAPCAGSRRSPTRRAGPGSRYRRTGSRRWRASNAPPRSCRGRPRRRCRPSLPWAACSGSSPNSRLRQKAIIIRRVRILTVLLLAAGSAIAAPFAVQVGDARIALDAPPGFADVQSTGSPRLFELAESLTSPSNRILLFALEDGDVRRFSLGDSLELRRYVIVVTPTNLETARTTLSALHALAA